MADQQLAKEALRHFKKQGLDIRLGAKVTGAAVSGRGVEVTYTDAKGEQHAQRRPRWWSRSAAGRTPRSCSAEGTGVALDERGFIKVDDECRTGVEGVWAVGDCVRGPMLAHKGKEEGVMVADLIAGRYGEVNYKIIPSVIYTAPGDRLGRPDRGAGQGQRPGLQGRRVSVPRQRPRARDGSGRRLRQAASPRRTTTRSSACTSSARWPAS